MHTVCVGLTVMGLCGDPTSWKTERAGWQASWRVEAGGGPAWHWGMPRSCPWLCGRPWKTSNPQGPHVAPLQCTEACVHHIHTFYLCSSL